DEPIDVTLRLSIRCAPSTSGSAQLDSFGVLHCNKWIAAEPATLESGLGGLCGMTKMNRRSLLLRLAMVTLAAVLTQALGSNAEAADKLKAAASFSILGDMLHQVGGDRVEVISLVGPNGDAHVYEPAPTDARHLSEAKLLVINGLGFEGRGDA